MGLFGNSRDSAFDLLGQARERVLSNAPKIPPPGTLARPGRGGATATADGGAAAATTPRFSGGPVASPVIERLVEQFVDIDGDPLLVIDDELDVAAITPEDGVVEDEPAKVLGVRSDTAVVFGIGLVLVVAIAYLAGRTTTKPGDAAKTGVAAPSAATAGKTPVLQPPAQAPPVAGSPLDGAADDSAASAPAPAAKGSVVAQPVDDAAAANAANGSRHPSANAAWEVWVVTSTEEKADKVVAFLNDSPKSPISGRLDVEAYAKKATNGAQVRIRGLEKKDDALLARVQAMSDPTGGGSFKGAILRSTKR